MTTPLLSVEGLSVEFPISSGLFRRARSLRAVDDVSLTIHAGEALGIVGESGCGKSTLARAVLQLVRPTAGQVTWLGKSLNALSVRELRPLRSDLQIIFQDPLASLNPRMKVGQIVAEPLLVHRRGLDSAAREKAVATMLERVGLSADMVNRYPHEFSGGQCQRIGIARAMILEPRLLICDEAVSALDVSIQAQIVNLLQSLKRDLGLAILFVSHNLAVVRHLCDRVMVLYMGRAMEVAPSRQLYEAPLHPYTRALLAAVPIPDPDIQPSRLAVALSGELPSPIAPPSGCVFRTRCPQARERCAVEIPQWQTAQPQRQVACHFWST